MMDGTIAFGALLIAVFFILCGCSASTQGSASRPAVELSLLTGEQRSDLAMEHYIAGSIHESKAEFEEAIREYETAFLYDSNPTIAYALSTSFSELGKAPQAAKYARIAVDADTANTDYREQLAGLFYSTFQMDSAAVEYERLLRQNPENIQYKFVLARIYQTSKPLTALSYLESIRDRIGAEWDVLFPLAELYTKLGRTEEALTTMEDLRRLEPDNESLLEMLAAMYLENERPTEALEMYMDLADRFPAQHHYTLAFAGLLKSLNRWPEAAVSLHKLLVNTEINRDEAMQIGELFFQATLDKQMEEEEAYAMFDTLENRFTDDWRPHWYRGATRFNSGNVKEALPEFQAVINTEPHNIQAHDILARSYLTLEDFPTAIKELQWLVDHNAAGADTYSYLGYAFSRLGKDKLAIEVLEKALSLDPHRIDAISTLALTYDGMKQYDQSDKLYETALVSFHNDTASLRDASYFLVLNNFAYTLSERGIQLDRALEMSKQAVAFDGENSSYLDTIGWIYFKMGKYDLATKYISLAIEARKKTGQAVGTVLYDHLGDVYFTAGNQSAALSSWKAGLQEEPDNASLQEKINRNTQ